MTEIENAEATLFDVVMFSETLFDQCPVCASFSHHKDHATVGFDAIEFPASIEWNLVE